MDTISQRSNTQPQPPLNPPYTNVVGCYDIRQTQFPLHLYILSGLQLYTIIYIVLGLTVRGG